MKAFFKLIRFLLAVILVAVIGGIAYLSATEYMPEFQEEAPAHVAKGAAAVPGEKLTVLTWNTGYAGLDQKADFFMDGGSMVNPVSQEAVKENMQAIGSLIREQDADIYLLQEVDRDSSRTEGEDQLLRYTEGTDLSWAYGVNYRCRFVPYPLPPLGKMETGVVTLTSLSMEKEPLRVSLPCPFNWPVRVANMKRCALVTRHSLEGTDKELVVIDLHLEAYDHGEGKQEQTKILLDLLEKEYAAGNYVIAGGDFNQTFPGTRETFPIREDAGWKPGSLEGDELPEGWKYVFDGENATCRLLDQPYAPESANTQVFVIDGFIVSPNVQVESVETVKLGFRHSDHNPVKMEFVLVP